MGIRTPPWYLLPQRKQYHIRIQEGRRSYPDKRVRKPEEAERAMASVTQGIQRLREQKASRQGGKDRQKGCKRLEARLSG